MADIPDSILNTTKKLLGFENDYTAFDLDIITHINSVFFNLQQMGIGPINGFMIQDETAVWSTFTDTEKLNAVKSYMFLRVRLMFDPPTSSFVLEALKKQAEEFEWRMNVHMEGVRNPWPIIEPTTS